MDKERAFMRSTSLTAFAEIEPNLTALQTIVLGVSRRRGRFIDEDLERELAGKMTPQSVRSRRAELVAAGLIRPTGEKRRNSRGGKCMVWEPCATVEKQGELWS